MRSCDPQELELPALLHHCVMFYETTSWSFELLYDSDLFYFFVCLDDNPMRYPERYPALV